MTQDRIWCVPTSGAFVNTRLCFSPRSFTFFAIGRKKNTFWRPPLRAPKNLYFVSCGFFNKLFLVSLIISRPKVWSIFSLCGLTSCSLITAELSYGFVISVEGLSNAVSQCCENTTCFTLIMNFRNGHLKPSCLHVFKSMFVCISACLLPDYSGDETDTHSVSLIL